MDNFQIETAQNIGIHQNVAGIGDRILAFLIDGLILVGYAILASFAIAGLGLDGGQQWVYYLIIGLPVFMYYLVWETFNNGRTPGKAALNIRVVRLDGSRPAFSQYIIRWLLRLIDISLSSGGVALVTILLNGKGQRLGDMAAGTAVISERNKMQLSQTLHMDIPENYVPTYSQVTILKDRDIQKIKKIYYNARRNGYHNVIVTLADKVAVLLEVKPVERPLDFIDRVLKDYNYYTQK
ncbi:RDD family protein [Antarcticibacterium arcticum]|uniref:RDD family protein n=1 Tax=Antarcticibacterium arcticum TaxID=2585771 RepID=A0A5B8YH27_9FLAO|nr:RDD family protein [Antarcticibacterium arcticum]QED37302.1 RDD family protein [Antarcticibacterium arcticum]